jgi:hypothetical protein
VRRCDDRDGGDGEKKADGGVSRSFVSLCYVLLDIIIVVEPLPHLAWIHRNKHGVGMDRSLVRRRSANLVLLGSVSEEAQDLDPLVGGLFY